MTSVSEISRLEAKISSLENTLEIQQGNLQEQEIQLRELTDELGRIDMLERKISFQEESNQYLDNMLYVYMELVNHTTTFKTALLNDAHLDGKQIILNMTYANKIADKGSPNGFYLEKTVEGTKDIVLSGKVPIYLLQGAFTYYLASWEDIQNHNGFFRLYEKDGEVVFIIQSYIP